MSETESRGKSVTLRLGNISGDVVDEIRAIANLRGISMNDELRRIVEAGLKAERKVPIIR